jgi:F-type H+-transporting ATPase subunit delta
MRNNSLAKRYGQALFDAGIENQSNEDLYAQILVLEQSITDNDDFWRFLLSHSISVHEKQALILDVFSKSFHPFIINFIDLILIKHRESILQEIILSYKSLYQISKGILPAQIETAKPIDEKTKLQISNHLQKKYPDNVIVFENKIDPTLLGGAKITVDDLVIDGSLKNQLMNLRKKLLK